MAQDAGRLLGKRAALAIQEGGGAGQGAQQQQASGRACADVQRTAKSALSGSGDRDGLAVCVLRVWSMPGGGVWCMSAFKLSQAPPGGIAFPFGLGEALPQASQFPGQVLLGGIPRPAGPRQAATAALQSDLDPIPEGLWPILFFGAQRSTLTSGCNVLQRGLHTFSV